MNSITLTGHSAFTICKQKQNYFFLRIIFWDFVIGVFQKKKKKVNENTNSLIREKVNCNTANSVSGNPGRTIKLFHKQNDSLASVFCIDYKYKVDTAY